MNKIEYKSWLFPGCFIAIGFAFASVFRIGI
jgi:hypothetical protein